MSLSAIKDVLVVVLITLAMAHVVDRFAYGLAMQQAERAVVE